MSRSVQVAMTWCGLAFAGVFFVGLLLTGFIPPIPPDNTAQEVADQYVRDQDRILAGGLIMMVSTGFIIPFTAVISEQMRRIAGRWTPLCSANLVAGAVVVVVAVIPIMMFLGIAFRPEHRDPEIIQAFNDFAWVPFVVAWPPAYVQAVCIAAAIFSDPHPDPLYPRWMGYALLWCATAFVPATGVPLFYHGPFAWNGLLSFWVAAIFGGVFFTLLWWGTLAAINRDLAEPQLDSVEAVVAR
jgi:hypothetical protein